MYPLGSWVTRGSFDDLLPIQRHHTAIWTLRSIQAYENINKMPKCLFKTVDHNIQSSKYSQRPMCAHSKGALRASMRIIYNLLVKQLIRWYDFVHHRVQFINNDYSKT